VDGDVQGLLPWAEGCAPQEDVDDGHETVRHRRPLRPTVREHDPGAGGGEVPGIPTRDLQAHERPRQLTLLLSTGSGGSRAGRQ
jgi:hypothetical protein